MRAKRDKAKLRLALSRVKLTGRADWLGCGAACPKPANSLLAVASEDFRRSGFKRDRLCDTRALVLLVVVSHVSELLSVRIRPREPDYARLPVFRHGDRARHHHLAGFRGRRFIGAVIHWLIG